MPTYFNFHLQSENLNEFHSQPGCNAQPRIRYILMKRPGGRQIKIRRGLRVAAAGSGYNQAMRILSHPWYSFRG
jgi:hypothetical protein